MKKIIALIMTIACLSSVLALTGCSNAAHNTKQEPLSLSIVIGAHKYFPQMAIGGTKLANKIYEACITYGNISSVIVDGNPITRSNYTVVKSNKDLTKSKEETIAKQNTNTILSECASAKATSPEVDTLEAIKVSANLLNGTDSNNKLMYVYDNGLCTTGMISQLTGDFMSSDHTMLVDKLESLHALPDLTGITVEWTGLGCTTGEQANIPDSYKYKLKSMWTTIIEASGGRVVFDTTPISGEEIADLPNVTPVPFAKDSLNAEDYTSKEVLNEPVVFNESTIKFVGDRAEFIDRDAAMKALIPIAELLKENGDLHIIIAGTTASAGSIEDCLTLSKRRAEACKKVLIDYGANESQIECIGLGRAENCFHVDDLNADGTLNEKMAKLNRAIYIFSSDSETAKSIVKG